MKFESQTLNIGWIASWGIAWLMIGLFVPAEAWAHQTGSSSYIAQILPESNQIDVLVTFPGRDAGEMLGWANEDGQVSADILVRRYPELATYVESRLFVENDGVTCETIETRTGPVAQALDAYWFLKAFKCPSLTKVTLTNRLFEGAAYNHLAKIQLGDKVFTTTFTSASKTYTVNVAEPGPTFDILRFLKLGIEHILTGLDHVLFVILFVILAPRRRALLAVVTSFTVAHTVTLTLSALDVISVSPRVIEPLIAFSIVALAAEAFFRKEPPKHLIVLTSLFGFLHGFGFAYILKGEIRLPPGETAAALATFNIGVEVGQLLIVLFAFPLRRWVCNKPWERGVIAAVSGAIGAIALFWTIERIFWA